MFFSYQQPLLLRCNLARFKPGSLLRLEAPFLRRFPLFVHSIVTGTLGSSYCGLRITAQPFTHPPPSNLYSLHFAFLFSMGACILRVHPPPPGFVIPFHFCVCLFLLTTGCIATPLVCVLQSLGIAFILSPLCVTSRTVHRSRIEIKKLYTTQFNCMEGGGFFRL